MLRLAHIVSFFLEKGVVTESKSKHYGMDVFLVICDASLLTFSGKILWLVHCDLSQMASVG